MPYTTKWEEPELFLQHKGVNVYCTYEDNDFDNGANCYWFVLEPLDDTETESFDIRDLGYRGGCSDDEIKAFLRSKIDEGAIVAPDEEEGL